jgi:hypothetical protein
MCMARIYQSTPWTIELLKELCDPTQATAVDRQETRVIHDCLFGRAPLLPRAPVVEETCGDGSFADVE